MTTNPFRKGGSMETHVSSEGFVSPSSIPLPELSRRRILGWGAGACGMLAWPSPVHGGLLDTLLRFFRPGGASKQVQVYVDVSLSATEEDRSIYEATFREIVDLLVPGDKVVLGLISNAPMSKFVPAAVRSLPRTGIDMNDIEAAERVKQELAKDFELVKTRPRSKRSFILDTLDVAGELTGSDEDRGSRWVVLLSDMMEDSEEARFDRLTLDARQIRQIIERRKARRLLPDLRGALVFVAGASAPDSRKYREIQDFWLAYFQSIKAVCSPGMYGRTVPRFPVSRRPTSRSPQKA